MAAKGNHSQILTLLNCYAPHTGRTEYERRQFLQQLSEHYHILKRQSSIILLGGDFNAKLGQRLNNNNTLESQIIGRHAKGTTNEAGTMLREFLHDHHLLAANTCFRHPLHQRVT